MRVLPEHAEQVAFRHVAFLTDPDNLETEHQKTLGSQKPQRDAIRQIIDGDAQELMGAARRKLMKAHPELMNDPLGENARAREKEQVDA